MLAPPGRMEISKNRCLKTGMVLVLVLMSTRSGGANGHDEAANLMPCHFRRRGFLSVGPSSLRYLS